MVKFEVRGNVFEGVIIGVKASRTTPRELVFQVSTNDKGGIVHQYEETGELWVNQSEIILE